MATTLSKRLGQARPRPDDRRNAAVDEVRRRTHDQLIDLLGPVLQGQRLAGEELRIRVRDQLLELLARERAHLSADDRAQLIEDVTADVIGYGPINRYLLDPDVTEVMVNGPARVFVERHGKLERVPESFVDDHHLRRVIEKIVSQVGRRVDESTPMVDARLPDGSRVNAVVHPLAIEGPFLTVRKFSTEPYTMDDLIGFGTLTPAAATVLEACVAARLNVVVSGGTGSGKTTTLNVLSSAISDDERIIVIEDAKELQLNQEHALSMEARPPNIEGRGAVTIRDLVRNALRMRPDRIIVGEVRGCEALDMLQAMNTGHDGSLTTVHANSPRDALARIETMTLMAGFDLPVRAIRDQMASALQLIVQISRLRDGSRRITRVAEVAGLQGDVIVLQDVFRFESGSGFDSQGRLRGSLEPCGVRPAFTERLDQAGVTVPPDVFGSPARSPSRSPKR